MSVGRSVGESRPGACLRHWSLKEEGPQLYYAPIVSNREENT
jgi:hypothetical protein